MLKSLIFLVLFNGLCLGMQEDGVVLRDLELESKMDPIAFWVNFFAYAKQNQPNYNRLGKEEKENLLNNAASKARPSMLECITRFSFERNKNALNRLYDKVAEDVCMEFILNNMHYLDAKENAAAIYSLQSVFKEKRGKVLYILDLDDTLIARDNSDRRSKVMIHPETLSFMSQAKEEGHDIVVLTKRGVNDTTFADTLNDVNQFLPYLGISHLQVFNLGWIRHEGGVISVYNDEFGENIKTEALREILENYPNLLNDYEHIVYVDDNDLFVEAMHDFFKTHEKTSSKQTDCFWYRNPFTQIPKTKVLEEMQDKTKDPWECLRGEALKHSNTSYDEIIQWAFERYVLGNN